MKKSPLKTPPLRNPGQSLDEKIQDVGFGSILPKLVIVTFLIMMAVLEWSRQIYNTKPSPIFISIIALIAITYTAISVTRDIRRIKTDRLGRDGERIVGQFLESLRGNGYQVFHDVISDDDFNIDHVVIGPAGIFTVETKTISKPVKGQSVIEYDGEEVLINGNRPERNPIIQAKAESNWLKQILNKSTARDYNVQPVVLYPGWFIESKSQRGNVWVLEPKALPAFLKNEGTNLQPDEISLAVTHLSLYIRATAEMLLKKL